MRIYKRVRLTGAQYFFTVNLAERQGNDQLIRHVDHLRTAFRQTRDDHPFNIDAIVILPEHLHCIWPLPPGDDDYPTRWRLIKTRFSMRLTADEAISASRKRKGERGIWQRRYWEHYIRNERDFHHHLDYIHYNPVKHGYVQAAKDWPYSSFQQWIKRGMYPENWAASPDIQDYSWE
ncbi:transposase [Methylobacter sp. BlB1]|uniref:REP-associated tyrosine transposase n=1 Tax=Methylobacter sp. BlB1 TaxID=2785914 RepID=UPI001894C122|nr:transposase [Methylobacter sp. BlB1]MBF6650277.1 transposase [Methylobacter sp. BlB1]